MFLREFIVELCRYLILQYISPLSQATWEPHGNLTGNIKMIEFEANREEASERERRDMELENEDTHALSQILVKQVDFWKEVLKRTKKLPEMEFTDDRPMM